MLKMISVDAVKISLDRQRREFNAAELHALVDSIQTKGLFHPIVLRIEGDNYVLVAGERRLRAVKDIWALGGTFKYDSQEVHEGSIPYVSLSELSPLEAEEAELEENIQRSSLTWQERAAAHSRLSLLRRGQAEARGLPAPTVADLAVEVRGSSKGVNQEVTRRELLVAGHLDDPEVKAAANVDDAFKILRRKESAAKDRLLGEQVGRTFTANVHRALNEDSLDWLVKCPAEQFDVILTDPPYGMGADEFGDSGGIAAGAHSYSDSQEVVSGLILEAPSLLYRVAKVQAHCYLFCDIDQFHAWKTTFAQAGWHVFRTPFIWYKRTGARAPWPDQGPQRKYETILYAVKGKRPTLKLAGDVLDYPPDSNLGHSAQKPVALFEDLLRRSCHPGDSVLDPFMGTGTIFAAAHALKVRATGIELDQASYGIAVKRLEQLKAQKELAL